MAQGAGGWGRGVKQPVVDFQTDLQFYKELAEDEHRKGDEAKGQREPYHAEACNKTKPATT